MKNKRNGYHFNSSYWQSYKKGLPPLSQECFEIAFGMILGDATLYRTSREAHIKFEQGYKQKNFVYHLFDQFQTYCFMESPGIRFSKDKTVKSYWFKTFSFHSFSLLFDCFYRPCLNKQEKIRKTITEKYIRQYLTPRALAYWLMCDGSLQNDKKTLIFHSAGFSRKENEILSLVVNDKFGLTTKVISHKKIYFVIQTSSQDSSKLRLLIKPYIIPSLKYKIPCSKF